MPAFTVELRLSIAATLAVLTVPALAQAPTAAQPAQGEATPEEARAALNAQQVESARRQLAENAASRKAYEDAVAAREEQIRRDLEAHEAEKARLAREHEAAMERWRADAAACRGGDRTRCAHR